MLLNDSVLIFKVYTHWAVQFSVHRDGLLGLLGPVNVSPQCLPLHVLICTIRH
jgi:hypothetical protein